MSQTRDQWPLSSRHMVTGGSDAPAVSALLPQRETSEGGGGASLRRHAPLFGG